MCTWISSRIILALSIFEISLFLRVKSTVPRLFWSCSRMHVVCLSMSVCMMYLHICCMHVCTSIPVNLHTHQECTQVYTHITYIGHVSVLFWATHRTDCLGLYVRTCMQIYKHESAGMHTVYSLDHPLRVYICIYNCMYACMHALMYTCKRIRYQPENLRWSSHVSATTRPGRKPPASWLLRFLLISNLCTRIHKIHLYFRKNRIMHATRQRVKLHKHISYHFAKLYVCIYIHTRTHACTHTRIHTGLDQNHIYVYMHVYVYT